MMLRYYLWPLTEKILGYLPLGRKVYETVGYWAQRNSKGRSDNFRLGFRLARKAKEIVRSGGTIIDVGTGWFHLDAFLLWLVGDYKIYLFDVADKARLVYIRNYLGYLRDNIDLLVAELGVDKETSLNRLDGLLCLETREDIYQACNFELCVIPKPNTMFLPEESIDLMVSTCVLNHIPLPILVPELVALRRMLKPGGRMYHMLGHEDHWAFHDGSANQFNYYRYSDRLHRWLFDTDFEFQNRLVKQEWIDLFRRCGLEVEEYNAVITDESREQIAKLPYLNSRFAKYPIEDLAITHSYVLLRRAKHTADSLGGAELVEVSR